MKDFHDTHSNLSQWLSAKDRMMTALGPISSDSRMVQTQVQQVSSLLCYFFSYFVCNLRIEMIIAVDGNKLSTKKYDKTAYHFNDVVILYFKTNFIRFILHLGK